MAYFIDNPKVIRRETGIYGFGVFATDFIKRGEFISRFDGNYEVALNAKSLPVNQFFSGRHAIEYDEGHWRDGQTHRIARYIAHSCDPNCGIQDRFNVIAMRDIEKGEEITWDYAMTEDSDFEMNCLCGAVKCRKVVGAFSMLSAEERKEFTTRCEGFISQWLVKKYKL